MDQPTTQFPHRSRTLITLVCLVGVVFIIRLFYLQVIQHGYYESEALKEHITKFTIAAKRGIVYAHDGSSKFVPLVLNEPVYTAYADPRYVKEPDKAANVLRRVAGGNVVTKFEDGLRARDRQYVVLAKDLSKQQAELIKAENLSGIGLQETEKRVYPEGQLASQLLGFVNDEGKGQYGLEEGLNNTLGGTDGQLKTVTDVHGIPISIGPQSVQVAPKDGKNVVLTIDRTIQHKVETALKAGLEHAKATKGSVIVVDPNNGHVLAMANLPTYDPNEFGKNTDFSVFQNRTISPYEPGSVIKTLTMAAGLNEGVIEPSTTYNNTGSVRIADATIKNVLQNPRGAITMTQVLQYSFNTGAVFVVQQLGGGDINRVAKQKLYEYFDGHYFFGHPTGIELAGDIAGEVTPPDDPDGGPVRYANMAFGQGVTMSMVQVTAAFSAVINGGVYYTPQVVDGYLDADGKHLSPKAPAIRKGDVITAQASAKLRGMLQSARVSSSISRGDKQGYVIGGKTGTAQVYDPATGRYSATATIGSYLGFGGQDKPQYVIMVRVDDATIGGYSGSAAAAPIFTDISNWMLDYLQIQPRG